MKHFIKLTGFCIALFFLEGCFSQKQIIQLAQNFMGIQNICVSRPINVKYDPGKPNEVMVQATLANTNDVDVTGSVMLQAYVFNKNDIVIGISNYFTSPVVVFPKNKTNAYLSDFMTISTYIETPIQIGETYKFQIRLYNPVNPPSRDNPFTSCTLYNESIKIN